jgi:hypothetical protein
MLTEAHRAAAGTVELSHTAPASACSHNVNVMKSTS